MLKVKSWCRSSKVMREKIDAKSEAQGFPESRLPSFTEEDSAMILGSSDFLGMNFYTAQVTSGHCYQVFGFNLLEHQIVYPEASDPELVDYNAGWHPFSDCHPLLSLDLPKTLLLHYQTQMWAAIKATPGTDPDPPG